MSRYRLDEPTDLSREGADSFGHCDYAEALVETVKSVSTPFTVGLFGEWGSGKTTILQEAERRLRQGNETAFVIFDAWRYEGDALRREFLTDVSWQLHDSGQLKRSFNRRKLLEELRTERTEKRPGSTPGWREFGTTLLQVLIAAVVVWLATRMAQHTLGFDATTIERTYPVLFSAALVFALNAVARTIRVEHAQVRTPRLQDPDLFARRFRRLVKGVRAKRLVIAIDNLDRCAPDRVAELLATIKTFLEPYGVEKELVFVIAADDAALRRHLTAQEMKLSPSVEDPAGAAEDAKESVSEYLRKFFNATLRVSDALDEELQVYTRRELADFFDAEAVDDDVAQDVVDMVVSALRRNPRRIKQFVNNLQLKLDLLRAREASARISPPVSSDLRLVAKLLVIEEQWPERYLELRKDHRLLHRWHDGAGAPVEAADDEADDEGDEAFDAFLLSTAHIDDQRARAVIHLKLDAAELSLPRYADWLEALDTGRSSAARGILDEADMETSCAYARTMERHLATQLKRSRAEALNTVKVLSEVAALRDLNIASVNRLLTTAVRHPVVGPRLGGLTDIAGLFAAARPLAHHDFSQLVEYVVAAVHRTDEQDDHALLFGPHLVPYVERLDAEAQAAVRAAIASSGGTGNGVLGDVARYLPLVEAAPALLPANKVEAALGGLSPEGGLTTQTDAYRVAVRGVVNHIGPDDAPAKLLQATVSDLMAGAATSGDDAARAVELSQSALDWLTSTPVSHEAVHNEAQRLNSVIAQASPEQQSALVLLQIELIRRSEDSEQDALANALVTGHFSQRPEQALDFYESHVQTLPIGVRSHLATTLVPLIAGNSGNTSMAQRAVRLMTALPSASTQLAAAAEQAATQARPDFVRLVLADGRSAMADEDLSRVIDAVVNHAHSTQLAPATNVLPLLELDATQLTLAQLDRVKDWAVAALAAPNTGEGRQFIEEALSLDSWRDVVSSLVEDLAQRIVGQAGTGLPNLTMELQLVSQAAADFPPARKHELSMAVLSGLNGHPSLADNVSSFLDAMTSAASAEDRKSYVEQLIALERGQADNYGVRQSVLHLAKRLAGDSRTNAFRVLRARLEELTRDGSSDEQALAQAVAEN